jgi:hypothetical protein
VVFIWTAPQATTIMHCSKHRASALHLDDECLIKTACNILSFRRGFSTTTMPLCVWRLHPVALLHVSSQQKAATV